MALHQIRQPADLRELSYAELAELSGEIRDFIVNAVAENAGHLGSNLGVVLFVAVVSLAVFGTLGALIGTRRGHRAVGLAIGLAVGVIAAIVMRVLVLAD